MHIQEKKLGVIRSWNKRGFAIIRVGDESSLERYFLHVSQIRSGTALPQPGMAVKFLVSDKPPAQGQLRQALEADIDVASVSQAPAAVQQ